MKKVEHYIDLAWQVGGVFESVGSTRFVRTIYRRGILAPGVDHDLDPHACSVEEIFGPVVVHPFDTEAEAVEMANSVDYGLGFCLDAKPKQSASCLN